MAASDQVGDPSRPVVPVRPEITEGRPRSSCLTILLALFFGGLFLAGLVILTLGYFGPVIVIVAGIFGFAAFHYLVWGWWLSKAIHREAEEERRRTK